MGLLRHRQTKGPGTDRHHLNYRVTPRLYRFLEERRQCRTIASTKPLHLNGWLGEAKSREIQRVGSLDRWDSNGPLVGKTTYGVTQDNLWVQRRQLMGT